MLRDSYHIVCVNSEGRPRLSLRLRRWHLLLAALLVLGLVTADALLLPSYTRAMRQREALRRTSLAILEQRERIYAASYQLQSLQDGFARIAEFDSKLRIMLSLAERPAASLFATGGTSPSRRSPFHILYSHTLIRDMRDELGSLEVSMLLEEAYQQDLFHAVSAQQERLARIPVIWPTRGRLTSGFGWRGSPLTGKQRFHKGIDITTPTGTPIKATAQGRVVLAGWFSTYGQCVEIDHGDGIHTRYGHMSKVLVEEGQVVYRGDIIGLVGSTGRSVAPHVHYEVLLSGGPTNPLNYILR